MTFISVCKKTDVFTFMNAAGQAVSLTPHQIFNNPPALDALPRDFRTLLAKKLIASATKSA